MADEGQPHNGASLVAHLIKNLPEMQETSVQFLGQEDLLKKCRLLTPVFLGFPGGSAGKKSACNVGNLDWIPGLGRSPGEGKGFPLQYSGLENLVHGVAKSQTQQSSQEHSHLWRMHACDRVCQTHELTYVIGLANACSHL